MESILHTSTDTPDALHTSDTSISDVSTIEHSKFW